MRKLRVRKNIKKSKVILLAVTLVFFFTGLIFSIYSNRASEKIVDIANLKLKEYMEGYLSSDIGYDILNGKELDDILVVTKNDNGEILYIDYNLDKAYKVLDIVTTKLNDLITDLEKGNNSFNNKDVISGKEGIALKLPLFVSSKNVLIANLGPKIYVPVNFVGSILTNIRSNIVDYGLNNALAELYVTIKLTSNLMLPIDEEKVELEYDVLIASKIINGRVPEVYGGMITSKSSMLSIPLE